MKPFAHRAPVGKRAYLTAIGALIVMAVFPVDSQPLQKRALPPIALGQVYDTIAQRRVESWRGFIAGLQRKGKPELEKIHEVNAFFNALPWRSDLQLWGVNDYWATPMETLAKHGGDCEDLAVAKYFSLLATGVAPQKLRLAYVQSLRQGVAHIVVLYFPNGQLQPVAQTVYRSSPWVLDNLEPTIQPLHQRADLLLAYTFDQQDLWLAHLPAVSVQSGSRQRLSQWDWLLRRHELQSL